MKTTNTDRRSFFAKVFGASAAGALASLVPTQAHASQNASLRIGDDVVIRLPGHPQHGREGKIFRIVTRSHRTKERIEYFLDTFGPNWVFTSNILSLVRKAQSEVQLRAESDVWHASYQHLNGELAVFTEGKWQRVASYRNHEFCAGETVHIGVIE